MVWMSSADGRLEYVNNRMLDYLGCDFDGLAGRKWTRFVHDDDLAGVTSQWTESLASGKALEVEERLRRRDGIFRWHLVRALPVRDERGRIDRWVGTCVDIDDQKQAQVLLKSSRERLETAVTLRTQELVKANAALRASEEKLRKLSAHLQSAREAERTAVAREIHDELGALLTAVKMDLARYLRNCHDMPQASQDLLTGVAALVDTSIQTLRRIATQLRPSILDHLGLWPALEWQLDEFQNRYGVRCHIEFNAMPSGLAKDAQTALFRIVQEALTNVARHAQATRVRLIVGEADGCAAIEIVDDGVGIPPEKLSDPTSCGIQGMHERAEAFGGRITLKSTRGGGTRIFIRFPLLEVAHQAIAGEVA
jgi:PAS domain S-box-containing protein